MGRTQRVVVGLIVGGIASAVAVPGTAFGSAGYFTALPEGPAFAASFRVAAPLPNGQVMIGGGVADGGNVIPNVEIYDPGSETFTQLPTNPGTELTTPRFGAVAAPLPDGEVLIAGGSNGSSFLQSAELFNPVTETFTGLPASGNTQLAVGRELAVAAPLPNGDVLIAGGSGNTGCVPTTEIFDPGSGTFSQLSASGNLHTCVVGATAAPVPNGDVLIAGDSANAQLFNPSADTFSQLSTGSAISADAISTSLPDGQVLIAGGGGSESTPSRAAYVFNPSTDTFTALPTSANTQMTIARDAPFSAPLPNGEILIAAGFSSASFTTDTAEVYVTAAEAAVSGGSFGEQAVAQTSAEQSLVVTNVGAQILRIAGATISGGTNPGDFTITGNACAEESLDFGHSCAITVQFTPGAAGARSATLTLEDNETTPASIALSGEGVPANAGPQGPIGPQGNSGTNGATGAQGPPGPAGQNGRVELITCKSATTGKGKHKKTVQRCTTSLTSSPIKITTAGASTAAVLSRGKTVYATGSATRSGKQTKLLLTPRQRIGKGRYMLTLTHGPERERQTITID
jgi:hypothetical protein